MSDLNKVTEFNKNQLENIVSSVIDAARQQGATAAEAGLSIDDGISVTVRMGDVEVLEHHRDQVLAVTVYKNQAKGSASTSDFSKQGVEDAVKAAYSIANYTAQDSYSGLAEAELMASSIPDLDLYHPWNLSTEEAIKLAYDCEAAALGYDEAIKNSEGATVTTHKGVSLYANTHGFLGGYAGTRHSLGCSVVAKQADTMQRDYWFSVARQQSSIEAADVIGIKAAERAKKRLGAQPLLTQQAPVIFSPEMARSLLGHFIGAIKGGALYRDASFLVGYKDKSVFPEFININEQPHIKGALGSAPFDNEGVATSDRYIVKDGVLQNYVLDTYSAKKLGMQTTGNAGGVRNLSITDQGLSIEELLKQMHKGLLVTELMGHGVNAVTGDYSRGASGYWVEGGEIQYPVEEITIAGNLKEMFMGIKSIANDIDTRSNVRTGSILVDNMTIAGA